MKNFVWMTKQELGVLPVLLMATALIFPGQHAGPWCLLSDLMSRCEQLQFSLQALLSGGRTGTARNDHDTWFSLCLLYTATFVLSIYLPSGYKLMLMTWCSVSATSHMAENTHTSYKKNTVHSQEQVSPWGSRMICLLLSARISLRFHKQLELVC